MPPFSVQICHEFERFSTYLPDIKVAVFYGGVNIKTHKDILKNECPHIVVGTPGRILGLARDKDLSLKSVRHFILDECDKMLESLGMALILEMTASTLNSSFYSQTITAPCRCSELSGVVYFSFESCSSVAPCLS